MIQSRNGIINEILLENRKKNTGFIYSLSRPSTKTKEKNTKILTTKVILNLFITID